MLKRSIVVAALFGAMTVGANAGQVPSALNVGVYPSYPPLDMRDPATGALSGFDIELSHELEEGCRPSSSSRRRPSRN